MEEMAAFLCKDWINLIESILMLGALIVAILQLRRLKNQILMDYNWKRKEKALAYSKMYHSLYSENKQKIEAVFSNNKSIIRRPIFTIPIKDIEKAIETDELTASNITGFLSYYENIGISVRHGVADFDVIVDLMGTTYYKTYRMFKAYIEDARSRNIELWKNIQYLAKRIEKETDLIKNSVLILSDDTIPSSKHALTPFKEVNYNDSYKNLIKEGDNANLCFIVASPDDFAGNGLDSGWTVTQNKWERIQNINPLLVFDKFKSINDETRALKKIILENNIPIINNPEFSDLLQDKKLCYDRLNRFFIPTVLITKDNQQLNFYIDIVCNMRKDTDLSIEKFVLKPKDGHGGRGIKLINRGEVYDGILDNFVLQPFLDTSNGIPDLLPNHQHDLRVILLNGQPVMSYIRTPNDHDFISNGGIITYIPLSNIPDEINSICREIDIEFEKYNPRFYSVDFGYGHSKKPWVFELNAKPGIVWDPNNRIDDIENTKILHNLIVKIIHKKLWE